MGHHVHLLLQTGRVAISTLMRRLLTGPIQPTALLRTACLWIGLSLACAGHPDGEPPSPPNGGAREAQRIGELSDPRLEECSGMDASTVADDLFWAINDGGHGSYLYALGADGRDRGRVRVEGAENRDWEGIDTFQFEGAPFILIADFGDNESRHRLHTLYILPEPPLSGERFPEGSAVSLAWRLEFRYPDGPHDAEGVAVAAGRKSVLILTKRDEPPILFELPLFPPAGEGTLTARKLAGVVSIPPPTAKDLLQTYGRFRSQPTAMDLDPSGRRLVILTYKHAYLFEGEADGPLTSFFDSPPRLLPLPLPQERRDLRQREAICFSRDGRSVRVTSEGVGAGIYRIPLD